MSKVCHVKHTTPTSSELLLFYLCYCILLFFLTCFLSPSSSLWLPKEGWTGGGTRQPPSSPPRAGRAKTVQVDWPESSQYGSNLGGGWTLAVGEIQPDAASRQAGGASLSGPTAPSPSEFTLLHVKDSACTHNLTLPRLEASGKPSSLAEVLSIRSGKTLKKWHDNLNTRLLSRSKNTLLIWRNTRKRQQITANTLTHFEGVGPVSLNLCPWAA